MATSSFAVGSVSVAIVWGTFFYPPPPDASVAPADQAPEVIVQPAPARSPQIQLADQSVAALPVAVAAQRSSPAGLVMVSNGVLAGKP